MENFNGKMISLIFLLKTLIVGTRSASGSNEYPQSMFWIKKNKKNRFIPCELQFYCKKVVYGGVYITWTWFPDVISHSLQDFDIGIGLGSADSLL